MSQENTERLPLAAHRRLQGETMGAVTRMMERIVKNRLIAISKRAGWLQGATIKCWKGKDLTF